MKRTAVAQAAAAVCRREPHVQGRASGDSLASVAGATGTMALSGHLDSTS